MANDDKSTPPEPRPSAHGQLAPAAPASTFDEDSAWEREVAAWDPAFSPGTPPPLPMPPPEPPPPDSAELVLDDVSSGEIVLTPPPSTPPPGLPPLPPLMAAEPTPAPLLVAEPTPPLLLADLYGDEAEPTVVSASPGAAPEDDYPLMDESSGILVIPEIAELEAGSTAPPATPEPPEPPPPPVVMPAIARELGRELTEDGLPDVSALFMDASEPAPSITRWSGSTPSAGGAFEEELPAEELVTTLALTFPVRPSRPLQEIADAAAAFVGEATLLDETAELRQQLALQVEELAGLRALADSERGEAVSRAICRAAVGAGRAAERLGSPDAMDWYEQALAEQPDDAPALRGRLRLLIQAGALEPARETALALARILPSERAAYQLILEHTRPGTDLPAQRPGEAGEEHAPSVGRLLLDCERALAQDARSAAAASLEKLAHRLPGDLQPALRAFAAVLFESAGDSIAADQLRHLLTEADDARTGFAALRDALRMRPAQAMDRLARAVEALPPSPLSAALLRWAARLARAQQQPERARALLARAEPMHDAGQAFLPLLDQVEIASTWPEGAPIEQLLLRLEHADPDGSAISARRMASRLNREGRSPDALEVVRRARGRGAAAEPSVLGLLAEQSAFSTNARDTRLQALQLWGELDLARSTAATIVRAHTLLRAEETRAEGIAALELAARSDSQDPCFWWLSWQLRRDGRSTRAAEALLGGAAAWSRPGLERLVFALRERAQELDLAGRPENLAAYLPKGPLLPPTADDPARLVRELLAMEREPRGIAEAFQHAATEGSRYRVLEAAGWFVHAGAWAEALTWVQAAVPQAASQPTTGLLLRRLAGLIEDPSAQAVVLAELIAVNPAADDVPELEFRRAEAMETAGRKREAAQAYRALLAGPLARDADLALRRVLWTLRDGDGLEALWRDEYDGLHGAGRTRGAAAALVERGRIQRELRNNPEAAQSELTAARLLDSDRAEARVMLLSLAGARPAPAEAVSLLEELAREMPAEAVSLHFLAALIADGQNQPEAAQRSLREALRRSGDRPSLAVVRRLVAAEQNRQPPAADLASVLEARAQGIVLTPGVDPRLATSLFSRAAEVEESAGRRDRAEYLYRRALEREPEHLPALIRLRKLLVLRGAFAEAVDALEMEALALRRPIRRAQALHQAAVLAADALHDTARARGLLERAVEADPRNDQAFTRLRKLLEEAGELEAVTELLARRLAGASPQDVTALRLERVDLLLGPLGDRVAAKRELRTLLENEPDNSGILGRLATLELEDGDFGAAAELSIRQARFERDPAELEACFLRIGRLYLRPLNDPRVALGAYERVLRISPGSREALEALSDLYARQGDSRKALAATERLVDQESDPEKRIPFLVRLGTLWETAGDLRRAGVYLRRAVDESPRSLQSIGELARFHERHKELQARNLLLEGALSLLSSDLRNNPENLDTLRTTIPILRWRQRRTSATAAAQLLARFSRDLAESRDAKSWVETATGGRRLAPLANPELDERALPRRVQGGVRHILRVLGPNLAHANRPDLRRWQVTRSARQRPGSGARAEFESVAADLGVRDFELYVSEADPRALAVEPADPPVIVVGAGLLKQGRVAARFAAGWCLRLVETHFDLLLEHSPMEAAALMAGVVRRFLPDYEYPELDDNALASAESRVARGLGKTRRGELHPFANEIAGSFTPNGLFLDAQETAARAGLLACGDLAGALDLIAAAAGRPASTLGEALEIPVALRLLDFALSEDHEELAQALYAVS